MTIKCDFIICSNDTKNSKCTKKLFFDQNNVNVQCRIEIQLQSGKIKHNACAQTHTRIPIRIHVPLVQAIKVYVYLSLRLLYHIQWDLCLYGNFNLTFILHSIAVCGTASQVCIDIANRIFKCFGVLKLLLLLLFFH